MKKSRDRLPERGNGNSYNGYGYGYPQDGHQQNNAYQQNNGYGGYQQESYPQNNGYQQQQNNGYNYQQDGYPQSVYQQNGYQQNNGYQNGYGGYGYNGYGYPGYGYPGYGGYGYGGYGYPGYGYPGYGGYGYGVYGGYPQMNYIADSYPQEDYGNPYAANGQAQTENGTVTAPQNAAQPAAAQANQPAKKSAEKPARQTASTAASSQETHEEAPAPAREQETQEESAAASGAAGGLEEGAEASSRNENAEDSAQEDDAFEETDPLRAEAEDLKRKWYAVTAEYENYRKRTANIKQEAYLEGRADIVKKLFPIGDNLDRAVKSCQDETTKKGIEMVLSAFDRLLESENITVVDPVGQPFDPNECEAIMATDPAEGQESGIVTEVYVKGYAQNGKVLRYAQVIVTK